MNDGWKTLVLGAGLMLVGVVAGAQLFGAPPLGPGSASAQATGYRECFVGRQESVDINSSGVVSLPDAAHNVRVPEGYRVVSGGGGDGVLGYVLFCR